MLPVGKKGVNGEWWPVGSGEWAVLKVETLVTPHCPPPTAHRLGFRVRAKLGIDFPTGGKGCLPFFIRAKKRKVFHNKYYILRHIYNCNECIERKYKI